MTKRYFGTDGIRGKVGEDKVTPEFVLKLGWAAGRVLGKSGGSVLIGKDTRISGYMFESALEAGLAASGMNVLLTGPMPTPTHPAPRPGPAGTPQRQPTTKALGRQGARPRRGSSASPRWSTRSTRDGCGSWCTRRA